jgi:hypothetical protein
MTTDLPPIALIIFNRPHTTRRVLRALAKVRPARLYVIGDGPRAAIARDAEDVRRTRALLEEIDWDCDISTNFAAENLGLQHRVSSGLNWVFEQEEAAIIIEDDCVPDPSFFPFCRQLLDRYRDDSRVMAIAGNNFQDSAHTTPYSYYFSQYTHCWGWATWRSAWSLFDEEMSCWGQVREGRWLEQALNCADEASYWREILERVYLGEIDSWAYIWQFVAMTQHGLCILPEHNLVSNIGYGSDATHTQDPGSPLSALPTHPVQFPLRHPPFVIRHADADAHTYRTVYHPRTLKRRAKGGLSRLRSAIERVLSSSLSGL